MVKNLAWIFSEVLILLRSVEAQIQGLSKSQISSDKLVPVGSGGRSGRDLAKIRFGSDWANQLSALLLYSLSLLLLLLARCAIFALTNRKIWNSRTRNWLAESEPNLIFAESRPDLTTRPDHPGLTYLNWFKTYWGLLSDLSLIWVWTKLQGRPKQGFWPYPSKDQDAKPQSGT